jgi:hypothetical protein
MPASVMTLMRQLRSSRFRARYEIYSSCRAGKPGQKTDAVVGESVVRWGYRWQGIFGRVLGT